MNKLLLTIGAIGTAAYLFFKGKAKAASAPIPVASPFGASGCELHVDAARVVVERVSRPVYVGMRHTILAADPDSETWRASFVATWAQVTETGMVQFADIIKERQCSAGDYDRARSRKISLPVVLSTLRTSPTSCVLD